MQTLRKNSKTLFEADSDLILRRKRTRSSKQLVCGDGSLELLIRSLFHVAQKSLVSQLKRFPIKGGLLGCGSSEVHFSEGTKYSIIPRGTH